MDEDQRKKDLEYCREIYKISAEKCRDEAFSKHLWLTNRLNETSEHFTERLFWFAGVSIGILPFTVENFSISNSPSIYILASSLILLVVSMILGIIDHFIVESFYKENNIKSIKKIENWQPVCVKLQNKWLEPSEIINHFENAESFDKGMSINEQLRSADWPTIAQTITVLLGFTLEIIYIFVQLL